jgi:hypothetical protein
MPFHQHIVYKLQASSIIRLMALLKGPFYSTQMFVVMLIQQCFGARSGPVGFLSLWTSPLGSGSGKKLRKTLIKTVL